MFHFYEIHESCLKFGNHIKSNRKLTYCFNGENILKLKEN